MWLVIALLLLLVKRVCTGEVFIELLQPTGADVYVCVFFIRIIGLKLGRYN